MIKSINNTIKYKLKSKKLYIFMALHFFIYIINIYSNTDLTLMGRVCYADGLGKIPIVIFNGLNNKLKINFYNKVQDSLALPDNIRQKEINKPEDVGNVLLYCDILWHVGFEPLNHMPNAKIKIAYSMLEFTKIPELWVQILNKQFDAVVVPDKFLVNVYLRSGVNIPIFTLPLTLELGDFLKEPIKKKRNKIFTFGMSGAFCVRKDHKVVLNGFAKAFGNNPNVRLILHGRHGHPHIINELKQQVAKYNLSNVKIISKPFTEKEYLEFMKNLDCYVLASKGEGFSITPREALALGTPCVLSSNTSHVNILSHNSLVGIPCNKKERATCEVFPDMAIGDFESCLEKDVSKSLLNMYNNYGKYIKKSNKYRKWASFYSSNKLLPYYYSLVKPSRIILGKDNKIIEGGIITNSSALYDKYRLLLNLKNKYN